MSIIIKDDVFNSRAIITAFDTSGKSGSTITMTETRINRSRQIEVASYPDKIIRQLVNGVWFYKQFSEKTGLITPLTTHEQSHLATWVLPSIGVEFKTSSYDVIDFKLVKNGNSMLPNKFVRKFVGVMSDCIVCYAGYYITVYKVVKMGANLLSLETIFTNKTWLKFDSNNDNGLGLKKWFGTYYILHCSLKDQDYILMIIDERDFTLKGTFKFSGYKVEYHICDKFIRILGQHQNLIISAKDLKVYFKGEWNNHFNVDLESCLTFEKHTIHKATLVENKMLIPVLWDLVYQYLTLQPDFPTISDNIEYQLGINSFIDHKY